MRRFWTVFVGDFAVKGDRPTPTVLNGLNLNGLKNSESRDSESRTLDRRNHRSRKTAWARYSVAWCLAILMSVIGIHPAHALVDTSSSSASTSVQPYIDRAIERISDFTLDNGMKFIVMERHQAPTVSFMTYVNVGSAEEEDGKTGAAHYLEHLAFKGTPRIGTTNYAAETEWLDKLDVLFNQLQQAKADNRADDVAQLTTEFEQAKRQASDFVIQNQYSQIVKQAGGVGLNATTSADETRYFYSFPSNKLELWMSLESERFLQPVFREFFEEKDVILEERRARIDNSPVGTMVEEFLATAFQEHPYGRPIIGYEDDLRDMTREDIREFFEAYYTPDHIVCAIVGDVDTEQVKEMAERYFGRFTAGSREAIALDAEPEQTEPREVTVTLPTQPWYFEGYHVPGVGADTYLTHQMLGSVLVGGRTSRLYKSLVEDQQLALSVQKLTDFPGNRFPNMMVLYALTAPGHTVDEIAAAIAVELDKITTEPVSESELERVKTQWRAQLVRSLDSNQGMASILPEYEAKTGSWRGAFDDLAAIETITADDILTVAQETFRPNNRTVGRLLPETP
ncbi:MAG: pitrilysin family protein [Leptolyngbyaceae bacterium]|nr:pitrilysin family protein [Leptolyngbyaceae bacterium]